MTLLSMAKYRILTVGFDLPGGDFEYIPFDSDQTLLDADIILFEPTLGRYNSVESYQGRSLLTEHSSFAIKERLNHWRSEIVSAVNAGRLVIVFLPKPEICFRYTGDRNFSGTGRSRVTTNIVAETSSYESVPNLDRVVAKSGTAIQLTDGGRYLGPYWSELASYCPYEAEIEGSFKRVLLNAKGGDRIVGAEGSSKNGILLFLPPIRYSEDDFVAYDEDSKSHGWTPEALKFGKRLLATLVALADSITTTRDKTPEPSWAMDSDFRLAAEGELEVRISDVASRLSELQADKASLETALKDEGSLRGLLFEQGTPLELSILEALELFGFDAEPFDDGESEFDAVFVSTEGRCLGEAEGRNNRAINIDKLSQLERNLQEDFARDDVEDYAKGVLFGNAYRLKPIDERGEFFTTKCISGAKRARAALVRTPDLFGPARYLKENELDSEYAKACRQAIFAADGEVVKFPTAPIGEESTIAEATPPRKQNDE
ncbi:MAG: hypothetical protein WD448_06695 [Woeseia sp.]